jgi:hypothetical protein
MPGLSFPWPEPDALSRLLGPSAAARVRETLAQRDARPLPRSEKQAPELPERTSRRARRRGRGKARAPK